MPRWRRRRQRESQKSKRLNKQTKTLHGITLFRTFFCRHCTTTMEKCLISRFMEDVNKRRLKFLSPSELEYGSEEFGSKSVRLHLTK